MRLPREGLKKCICNLSSRPTHRRRAPRRRRPRRSCLHVRGAPPHHVHALLFASDGSDGESTGRGYRAASRRGWDCVAHSTSFHAPRHWGKACARTASCSSMSRSAFATPASSLYPLTTRPTEGEIHLRRGEQVGEDHTIEGAGEVSVMVDLVAVAPRVEDAVGDVRGTECDGRNPDRKKGLGKGTQRVEHQRTQHDRRYCPRGPERAVPSLRKRTVVSR